jgi:hypothetical protein
MTNRVFAGVRPQSPCVAKSSNFIAPKTDKIGMFPSAGILVDEQFEAERRVLKAYLLKIPNIFG